MGVVSAVVSRTAFSQCTNSFMHQSSYLHTYTTSMHNTRTYCTIYILVLFAGDYVDIMESLTFNGSATFDQQCLNITILDDDVMELSTFMSQREAFQVLLRIPEPNDAVQLGNQTALVTIVDDDRKLSANTTFDHRGS